MSKFNFVYFMRPVGMLGPIKIGRSRYVDSRLTQLSTWSPFPLELLYFEEGDGSVESNIHSCFADYHSHREWFHPGQRLVDAISRLMAGEKIKDVVNLSDKKGYIHAASRKPTPPEKEGFLSYKSRMSWVAKRASKATGEYRTTPSWAWRIMDRWQGHHAPPIRPTAEEFERLDRLIADPVAHTESRSVAA